MPARVFDEFYRRYAGRMRRLAYRITRNDADAEDAVQDAFLRAHEKYGSFRHESSLWTWIYRITQTSALMILKKNRALRRVGDEAKAVLACSAQIDRHHTPEHQFIQSRLVDALEAVVDGMPRSIGVPMRDHLAGGLDQRDLCERHGLTLLATKARLHRARVFMRPRLRPHLGPRGGSG